MSSLIANQVKINMCLVSLKNSLFFALLLCDCSHLMETTVIITITACLTQLFAIQLTTATVMLKFRTQLVTRLLELQLTE